LLVSIFIGVSLGMAMGLKDSAEWLFSPIFIVAQAAPLAALIPVLTFAYGIGVTAKIFTVCIMAMPNDTPIKMDTNKPMDSGYKVLAKAIPKEPSRVSSSKADMVSVKDGSAALMPARPAYSQAKITARKETSFRKKLVSADMGIQMFRFSPKKGHMTCPPNA